MCRTVWLGLRTRSSRSFYIWKYDVRSHPGTQTIITIRQANLHPKYLLDPIFDRLDVTRGELSLSVHLFHYAVEVGARIGINPHFNVVSHFDQAEPRFWH